MDIEFSGFDWDDGNRQKCQKHGVSLTKIESLFSGRMMVRPDVGHSGAEERFQAVARRGGRYIFLVFTLRDRGGSTYIRPISARYMHRKESQAYEKENPDL
jgi:uncharacterized DUF497 family protein